MKIIEHRKGNNLWYKPKIENDPRFLHCSDGFLDVKKEYFDEYVLPLLLMHGWLAEVIAEN